MKVIGLIAILIGAVMVYAGVYGRSLRKALTGQVAASG